MKRWNINNFQLLKIIICFTVVIGYWTTFNCNASVLDKNNITHSNKNNLIEVHLTFNYTSHIYFDTNVQYVDIGYSEEIIWKFVDNMVKLTLKSKQISVDYTNMTVHTAQAIYGFILKLDEKQSKSPYYFISPSQALKNKFIATTNGTKINSQIAQKNNKKKQIVSDSDKPRDRIHSNTINNNSVATPKPNNLKVTSKALSKNQDTKQSLLARALKERSAYYNIGTIQDGIIAYLSNIYIIQDSIYMKITYKNRSTINFNLSYISFSIEKKKKKQNSILEELHILPTNIYPPDIKMIESKSKKKSIIYCLGSFIPTQKQTVSVYIGEEKGRIITFTVPNEYFLKAKKLE